MTVAPENLEEGKETMTPEKWRDSTQPLLPPKLTGGPVNRLTYNPFPYQSLGEHQIFTGYSSLADWIVAQKTVVIDGYGGVFYGEVYQQIQAELADRGILANWHFTEDYLRSEQEIEELVKPFLSQPADVWGKKAALSLEDFFVDDLKSILPDPGFELNIVIGIGAGLSGWESGIVYIDIPKNEIQYRMRAQTTLNIGKTQPEAQFAMYKRFYFVDWVVLDRHRNQLLDRITIVADGQQHPGLNWMFNADLAKAMNKLSRSVFRVRPWFEKGSWGGQWMKAHISELNKEEVNYAWSFELITPENGLVFESDGNLLEVSFDFLMQFEYQAVLGKRAAEFGPYFPIRFDFLDTFDGGNLSVQCHPSKRYIQENFGEAITQDETYYILDSKPGARVYLGFQEDIDPAAFRSALQESQQKNEELEVEKYVQSFPSKKHDLFLIPNGTVHSSGVNNMVLEISATPYIFTFKMYDWLALDLNGNPRPINIDRAFDNLRFERKGKLVEREHISHPVVLERGADWELIHLPTHEDHFYDIHRIEFDTEIRMETNNSCQVLMLVEGTGIGLEVNGVIQEFAYAETFIVPAAAESYRLFNKTSERAKVIKSFLKME